MEDMDTLGKSDGFVDHWSRLNFRNWRCRYQLWWMDLPNWGVRSLIVPLVVYRTQYFCTKSVSNSWGSMIQGLASQRNPALGIGVWRLLVFMAKYMILLWRPSHRSWELLSRLNNCVSMRWWNLVTFRRPDRKRTDSGLGFRMDVDVGGYLRSVFRLVDDLESRICCCALTCFQCQAVSPRLEQRFQLNYVWMIVHLWDADPFSFINLEASQYEVLQLRWKVRIEDWLLDWNSNVGL